MDIEAVAGEIVDAAVKLHMRLGPGLLESAYEALLEKELERRGLRVERPKAIALACDGIRIEDAYRVDLLVEGAVIVELKSVEELAPVHMKQLRTYLKLLDLRLGFLINFGAPRLVDGLHRAVNRYDGFASWPLRRRKGFPSRAKGSGASGL